MFGWSGPHRVASSRSPRHVAGISRIQLTVRPASASIRLSAGEVDGLADSQTRRLARYGWLLALCLTSLSAPPVASSSSEALEPPFHEDPGCAGEAPPPVPYARDGAGMLPSIDPPVEASAWQLQAALTFDRVSVGWTQNLYGEPPWEVNLPQDALFDERQAEWLSTVNAILVAYNASGSVVLEVSLEPAWVVWPDGADPYWLDNVARTLEAPNGAWSPLAVVQVPAEIAGNPRVQMEIPPLASAYEADLEAP